MAVNNKKQRSPYEERCFIIHIKLRCLAAEISLLHLKALFNAPISDKSQRKALSANSLMSIIKSAPNLIKIKGTWHWNIIIPF